MTQQKMRELENKVQKEYSNIAGMVILRDGKTEYENYFNNCSSDSRIHVYSITKSIVSILIGIAIDKGYIRSVEQKVLDFFPDYVVKKGEKTIQDIKLKDLLTMTAPYKYNAYIFPPYRKYFSSDDWVKFSLDLLGGRGQVGKFRYAPLIGLDILTGILTKATGQSVFEFATANLFGPLGIVVEKNITFHGKEEQLAFNKATNVSGWVADPTGVNAGGWGLTISAKDLAKIGQLFLNDGIFQGEQIISKRWIEESTRQQSRWDKRNLPYGYLWWLSNDEKRDFAAMGDGGNILYVNEEKKLVISITSLFVPNPKDRIKLIKEYIEPMFETCE